MDLYKELSEKAAAKPPSSEDIKSSLDKCEYLTFEQSIYLYALIIHYAVTVDHDTDPMPYKIKKLSPSGGVIINNFQLPIELQKIITKYIEITAQE
jgi:hypothetical protein